MSAITTAYMDLMGMTEVINIKNQNFHTVHIYPTFRDICLLLYQINKDILNNSIDLDDDITTIRHRVHLHRNKNNYEIYRKILESSIEMFGNNIDNLGFFFNNDMQLVGSTIYPFYISMDTKFFSGSIEKLSNNTFEFAKLVGESTAEVFQAVNKLTTLHAAPSQDFKFSQRSITSDYALKDVHHKKIFTENKNENTVITRLLLCLQEASTSVWLYQRLYKETNTLTIENYILLRLISIKADEIHDNLSNIRKYIKNVFLEYDKKSNKMLSQLMDDFDEKHSNEVRILRNMIHYSETEENFLDYIIKNQNENLSYLTRIINDLITDYLYPLTDLISNLFEIDKIRSMTYIEKNFRRLSSIIKKEDYYKNNYD